MRQLKPQFLEMLRLIKSDFDAEAIEPLIEALQESDPAVGLRINPLKGVSIPPEPRLVRWSRHGFYIDGIRPRFTFDPAFHQGLYYVQDPSSMVIESIVSHLTVDCQPVVYLDACAAPGGKTTAAMNVLPGGSMVIANEFDPARAAILRENVIKWGYPSVILSVGDTSRLASLGPIADIVAVDAPCSGEGMMRKEPAAVEQWSVDLVKSCAALQRQIIDNSWQTLRPGGYMIYSTCTFNRLEDEENLNYLIDTLGGESVEIPLPPDTGIIPAIGTPYHAARFMPGVAEGEGLFIAVVRKPGNALRRTPSIKIKQTKPDPVAQRAREWLLDPDSYIFSLDGDKIIATPTVWQPLIAEAGKRLSINYIGTEVATVKGRDLLPSQALAMSTQLNREAFHMVEVDYPTAISYLRHEAVTLPDAPRGILLLTYGSHPLGFVKNLGNRANNLYPAPWAIRSPHIPSSRPNPLQMPPLQPSPPHS